MAVLARHNPGTSTGRSDLCRNAVRPAPPRLLQNVIRGCLLVLLGMGPALLPGHADASGDSQLEYRVKSAFLLNFCKFVTWPETAFEKNDDPIILYVLGQNPFGEALDPISGKKAQGRSLEIRYASNFEKIGACHMLFICESAEDVLDRILPEIQDRPILTVGDMGRFVQRGGMIGLIRSGTNIRFMVNPTATETAGIKISSQLLKLAIIYDTHSFDGD